MPGVKRVHGMLEPITEEGVRIATEFAQGKRICPDCGQDATELTSLRAKVAEQEAEIATLQAQLRAYEALVSYCPQCKREIGKVVVPGAFLGQKCLCGWPVTSAEEEARLSHEALQAELQKAK